MSSGGAIIDPRSELSILERHAKLESNKQKRREKAAARKSQ
jgi:hypothetical protein